MLQEPLSAPPITKQLPPRVTDNWTSSIGKELEWSWAPRWGLLQAGKAPRKRPGAQPLVFHGFSVVYPPLLATHPAPGTLQETCKEQNQPESGGKKEADGSNQQAVGGKKKEDRPVNTCSCCRVNERLLSSSNWGLDLWFKIVSNPCISKYTLPWCNWVSRCDSYVS